MGRIAITAAALVLAAAVPAAGEEAAIDWETQVANINGEDGTRFSIETAGPYGCELSFLADGSKPDLVFYKIPDATSVLTMVVPPEWLADETGDEFNLISVSIREDGNAGMKITSEAFSQVADPERGKVLRVQNSAFDQSNLAGAFYLNFAKAGPEEDNPLLEWEFPASSSAAAASYFDQCLAWIRTRPDWQAEYGAAAPGD